MALSKLCMNSLYGKFGQRQNMSQTEIITEPLRFYQILLDARLSDLNVSPLSDEMIQVSYKYKDQFVENTYNTNIFIASCTTAHAPLRLYNQLKKLGKAVIYCDTDSIVYEDDGKNTVKTGDLLGKWTDELKDRYIKKWLATGPKSYYFETYKGNEVTKVKGFTLHHKNALKINGQALEKLIDRELENEFKISN